MDRGLWRGQVAGFVLHGVEIEKVSARERTEHLLYAFSRAFLSDPGGVGPLDQEETEVYVWLYQQVQQFKRSRGPMAMKDVDTLEQSLMKLFELLSEDHPELADRIIARSPPEKRLRGLAPEERLRGLGAEDRLRGLAPEDRLRGLSPEELERLKRLLH